MATRDTVLRESPCRFLPAASAAAAPHRGTGSSLSAAAALMQRSGNGGDSICRSVGWMLQFTTNGSLENLTIGAFLSYERVVSACKQDMLVLACG